MILSQKDIAYGIKSCELEGAVFTPEQLAEFKRIINEKIDSEVAIANVIKKYKEIEAQYEHSN